MEAALVQPKPRLSPAPERDQPLRRSAFYRIAQRWHLRHAVLQLLICSMRGAVAVSADLSGIEVQKGQDALTLYQFNTGQARHYFCKHCEVYTFYQRRSSPHRYGVNAVCIAGMSPFDFAKVAVIKGHLQLR